MRRMLTAVVLLVFVLPMYAQRWASAGRSTGSLRTRGFSGLRGNMGMHGISFGHHPRWHVIIGSRTHYSYRRYYRPHYPYAMPSNVYPYVLAPVYPLPLYDNYDTYNSVIVTPQPVYPYFPEQQSGLDTQMRQQHVGLYAGHDNRPKASPPKTTPQATDTVKEPEPAPQPEERPQPPTELVYRDGHRVQVRNYAIVGQTLWIFSEQTARKIPMSDLNLEATRRANEVSGVEFTVPQSGGSTH